ncbi:MAG: hypothetical protein A2X86_16105 [Bdellovibrionales bacterium GWA2_49_15]|nr:MAG: hypothetical protein A2X86_16105 [Bdellovibrionales bacterium GWA2_49_15]HAZ13208.1 hypothetical protein [Bdellovibrionales bacterium]
MKKLFLCLLIPLVSFANPIPLGHPNKGRLEFGRNLSRLIKENSEILRSVSPIEFQYGTSQMAAALLEIGTWGSALQRVPVWIGDISKKQGRKLAQHLTHQRGLDADIAYLVHVPKMTGHRFNKFHNRFTEQFGLQGKLGENFDLEANYQLLGHIVAELEVTSVYVGCGIYDALETHDKKQTVSIMKNIFAQKGHEDHFHLRLKCPQGVPQCSNNWWTDPSKTHKKKKKHSASASEKYRDC